MEQSPTLWINQLVKEKRKNGELVYNFGFGQSPFPIPQTVIDEAKKYIDVQDYLPVEGLASLREAIADFYTNNKKIATVSQQVLIGPGTKQLLFNTQMALRAHLLTAAPSWVSYKPQAELLNLPVTIVPTMRHDDWKITPSELRAAITKIKDGRELLLILNSPNNPTGQTYTQKELKALADVCRQYKVWVISDEIYSGLQHFGEPTPSMMKYYPEKTIISDGISKWVNAGGWRLGYLILPQQEINLLEKLITIGSETYSSANGPIQYAARRIFTHYQTEILPELQKNRAILKAIGAKTVQILSDYQISVAYPTGAFYAFPDWYKHRENLAQKGILNNMQLAQGLLDCSNIATLPGTVFNQPEESLTLRLALTDFDAQALRQCYDNKNEITNEDLQTHAAKFIEGLHLMGQFATLRNNAY